MGETKGGNRGTARVLLVAIRTVEASSFKPETLALHNVVGALYLPVLGRQGSPGPQPVHCSLPPFLSPIYFTLGMVSALVAWLILVDRQVAHLHYPYPQT